jgi:hypothetical protein
MGLLGPTLMTFSIPRTRVRSEGLRAIACVGTCLALVWPEAWRAAEAQETGDQWVAHTLPNSVVVLELPVGFLPENDACFVVRETDELYGRGFREVCASVLPDSVAVRLRMDSVNAVVSRSHPCYDCVSYSGIATDTLTVAGRRGLLLSGAAFGGLGMFRALPTVIALVPIGDGLTLVVHGRFGDPSHRREFIEVLKRIRVVGTGAKRPDALSAFGLRQVPKPCGGAFV